MSSPIAPESNGRPMAPSLAAWGAMSEVERKAGLATLVPIPTHEALPPESDAHIDA